MRRRLAGTGRFIATPRDYQKFAVQMDSAADPDLAQVSRHGKAAPQPAPL